MKQSILNRLSFVFLFQLLNYTFSFFFTPLLSRKLSYNEFATYSQIATIADFANVLLGFGLTIIIYKALGNEKENHKDIIKTCYRISLYIFAVTIILALALHRPLSMLYNNDGLVPALIYSSLYIGIGIPVNLLSSVLIFYGRLRALYVVSTLCNLGRFLVLFLASRVFHSFHFIFIGFTFFSVLNLILFHRYSALYMVDGFVNHALGRQLIRQGAPLSVNSILTKVIYLSGGVFVSQLIDGTKDFAVYRNGAFEMPFIGTLYTSLSVIIFPEIAKMVGRGDFDEIVALKKRISFNTSLVVYPMYIFFIFFGEEFIRLYLSDKFEGSAMIFIAFNALLLIRINDYEDIMINMGKARINMYIYILGTILNVILNYVLIKKFGSLGGAIATPITIFLMMVSMLIVTCRLINKKASDFFDFPRMALHMALAVFVAFCVKIIMEYLIKPNNAYIDLFLKMALFFSLVAFLFYRLRLADGRLIEFIKSKLVTFRNK